MIVDDFGVEERNSSILEQLEHTEETFTSSGNNGYTGVVFDDKTERLVASGFLATTSQTTLDDIISRFIVATSNNSLKIAACGSCARQISADQIEEILLEDIPYQHHLIPHTPHVAHELVNGLLLYPPALGVAKNSMNLCNECRNQLRKNL